MESDESGGVWIAEVPLVTGTTPYVRWGDWVPAVCVLVLVVSALAAGLRAAGRRIDVSQPGSRPVGYGAIRG